MVQPYSGLLLQGGEGTSLGRVSWAGRSRTCGDSRIYRRYGNYALVYLIHGRGWYRNERGVECDVVPGDLITVLPDVARAYGPRPGDAWREIYVIFDGPIFDLWRQQGMIAEDRPIRHLEPIDYWSRRLVQTVQPSGGRSSAAALQRVMQVQQLLVDMHDYESKAQLTAADQAWLRQAHDALAALSQPKVDWVEVSRRFGLTYAGFRKRFARIAGMSPARYVNRLRIEAACRMIETNRDSTLRHIARELGFADEFHLSRRFKQLLGISPAEFRARLPRN